MTMQHVSDSVSDLLRHIRVVPSKILVAITIAFGVTEVALTNHDRHKTVHLARMGAYLALRRHGFSYPEIGKELSRDHTTAMYCVKRAEALEMADEQFRGQLELVEQIIRPRYLKLRIEEPI